MSAVQISLDDKNESKTYVIMFSGSCLSSFLAAENTTEAVSLRLPSGSFNAFASIVQDCETWWEEACSSDPFDLAEG